MIHAVSLGEINATRALVEMLRKNRPELQFVVSVTTETGFARGKELYGSASDVTLVRYPLDFTSAIDRLLVALRPDVVALMELEVWPNFIQRCASRGVPVLLINGRITPASFKKYKLFRPVLGSMFRRLDQVCVQEDSYAQRFAELGVRADRLSVTGTMTFDNAAILARIDGQDELAAGVGLGPGSERIWVCGSTGPGEEKIVLDVYRKLLGKFPGLRLVVVPRKPERFDEVAQLIASEKFEVVRRSQVTKNPHVHAELRVEAGPGRARGHDGRVEKFYAIADVVFVGRSLVDLGDKQHGSDMIEPAAIGKPVIVGPFTGNFAEPMSEFVKRNAMAVVADADGLAAAVERTFRFAGGGKTNGRSCAGGRAQQAGCNRAACGDYSPDAGSGDRCGGKAMKLLDKLEREFRPYAIPNLSMYLVIAQGATLLVGLVHPEILRQIVLDRELVAEGQWWRLFTAILYPPDNGPFWGAVELWLFFIMGTALERQWGVAKFNFYMLIGYFGMAVACLTPDAIGTNRFWMASVLLAFAALYPDFEVLLYFMVPVKVKWIALLTWILYIVACAEGDWGTRAQVGAGIANYLLFFHREIWQFFKSRQQRLKHNMAQAQARDPFAAMHTCAMWDYRQDEPEDGISVLPAL